MAFVNEDDGTGFDALLESFQNARGIAAHAPADECHWMLRMHMVVPKIALFKAHFLGAKLFSRRAFIKTLKDDKAIAALANIGLSSQPVKG